MIPQIFLHREEEALIIYQFSSLESCGVQHTDILIEMTFYGQFYHQRKLMRRMRNCGLSRVMVVILPRCEHSESVAVN